MQYFSTKPLYVQKVFALGLLIVSADYIIFASGCIHCFNSYLFYTVVYGPIIDLFSQPIWDDLNSNSLCVCNLRQNHSMNVSCIVNIVRVFPNRLHFEYSRILLSLSSTAFFSKLYTFSLNLLSISSSSPERTFDVVRKQTLSLYLPLFPKQ